MDFGFQPPYPRNFRATAEIPDGRNWEFQERLLFRDKAGNLYSARPKSTTDGLSIPRAIENLIEREGPYWLSGALHDAAFRDTLDIWVPDMNDWKPIALNEQKCNELIDQALESQGCSFVERELIYRNLQLFGYKAFNEDRSLQTSVTLDPTTRAVQT